VKNGYTGKDEMQKQHEELVRAYLDKYPREEAIEKIALAITVREESLCSSLKLVSELYKEKNMQRKG
jgi:hypothetical protein